MDLTPKSSAPWWSLFDCCRSPSTKGDQDEDACGNEDEANGASAARDNNMTAPSLKVATPRLEVLKEGAVPDTPATACTDSSADNPSGEDLTLNSPTEKVVTFEEEPASAAAKKSEEMDLDDGETSSDTDESDCSYAEPSPPDENHNPLKNKMFKVAQKMFGYDMDIAVPEIDINMSSKSRHESPWKEDQQTEVKFYHFLGLMMLRHIFGRWLPGGTDPATNIFTPNDLLTQHGSINEDEKKELRKQKNFEVVPDLKREGASLEDMPRMNGVYDMM